MGILTLVLAVGYVPLALALSVVDLREHRLPNRLVAALAAWVLACLIIGLVLPGTRADALWALVLGGACAVLAIGIALLGPPLIGMGDAKVAGPVIAAAALPGWDILAAGILGCAVVGGAAGLVVASVRRSLSARFAYGPVLLATPLLGVLGAPLVRGALGV